jgi:hypothetical protein
MTGTCWRVCIAILLLGIAVLPACVATKVAEGRPGADLSQIVPGATRAEVEEIVGAPVREWTTSLGIRYRLYRYDAGVAPAPGTAAMLGILDAAMLGMISAASAIEGGGSLGPSRQPLMAVSYGPDDRVRGVFKEITEFSPLPEDGRVAPAGK